MALGALRFTGRWRVPGRAAEVFDLLADPESWPRWWPAAHAEARVLGRDGPDGGARVVALRSRPGGLALRWRAQVLRAEPPLACTLALAGDVEGTATWTLATDGPYVLVATEWRLRPRTPWRAALAWLLAPGLGLAFRRAARSGELALRLELRRRHALTAHERASVPPPPGAASRDAGARGTALPPVGAGEPDSSAL